MRRNILFILSLMVLLVSCYKEPVLIIPTEPAVTKTIQFRVAQGKDYSAALYDGVRATLRLTVSRELLSNGNNEVVWDSTFVMASIREFPPMLTPLWISKSVQIFESKEAVRVSTSIRYVNDNNSNYFTGWGEVIPRSFATKIFEVNL